MKGRRHVFILVLCCACALVPQAIESKKQHKHHHEIRARSNRIDHNLACEDIKEFQPIRARINSFKKDVERIVNYAVKTPSSGEVWNQLAYVCDTFGPRMSGSRSLELAIEHMKSQMEQESKLDSVSKEPAMVPNWQVLSQTCEITAPVAHPMSILTLGYSVSTNGPLEAEVVLVHDFDELNSLGAADKLKDKIVVFNYKFVNYPESVKYRTQGALRAMKYGAAAALIRSVTPFSIYSPHAGAGSKSIPTAALTVEDANLIERWVKRNRTVTIRVNIKTEQKADAQSYNLVGDLRGSSHPNEVVFVSGHLDSWYNTCGAMDDGGGMIISYRALEVLSKLNLRANRTMRAILWTAEEPGLVGARQYFEAHKSELDNFKAVIESDEGTFRPLGLSYKNMGPLGQCIIQEILYLTSARVSDMALNSRYEGSDIEYFTDAGVPGLSLLNENSHYFDYHHTSGDSMDVQDPGALDRASALFASTVYVLAQLVGVDLRN